MARRDQVKSASDACFLEVEPEFLKSTCSLMIGMPPADIAHRMIGWTENRGLGVGEGHDADRCRIYARW